MQYLRAHMAGANVSKSNEWTELIWEALTDQAAEKTAVCMVISHLEYSNAVLITLSKREISWTQRVGLQVLAARALMGRKACKSSTKHLKQLQWLPVHLRIEKEF